MGEVGGAEKDLERAFLDLLLCRSAVAPDGFDALRVELRLRLVSVLVLEADVAFLG